MAIDKKIKFANLDQAKELVNSVTTCVWNIDCNHSEINAASAQGKCKELPSAFMEICRKQYNMWQEKKKPKPKLSLEKLDLASQNLFDIVSVVHGKKSRSAFTIECKHLAESLDSYAEYLSKAKLRVEKLRSEESTEISDDFVPPNIALAREKVSFKTVHSKWSSQSSRKPERSI